MKRSSSRRAAAPAALALALALTACGAANETSNDDQDNGSGDAASGEPAGDPSDGGMAGGDLSGSISGAGASSQAAAMEAWRAGFNGANPDVTVNYDPVGSGGGREQFTAGGTLFGGTDAYLADEELTAATERCAPGELVEIPAYISPIAIAFNLEGVDSLNLDPATLAGIFNQEITSWDDPAIADQNPDVELPSETIVPVNRSDDSGTTENFVEYLSVAAPDAWPHEVSDVWPVAGGEAAQGTAGVVGITRDTPNTITYADASQVGELPTVAVQVGEEYVPYSPEAAAAIVDASEPVPDRGEFDGAIDLARDSAEAGTYPIVLVSYLMACTAYEDENDTALVSAFLEYVISEDGQTAAQDAAGSAPISDAVREDAQAAVDAMAGS